MVKKNQSKYTKKKHLPLQDITLSDMPGYQVRVFEGYQVNTISTKKVWIIKEVNNLAS